MAQINIEPWDKSTDSQYAWTQDTSKINILPSTKNLAWNEALGYFPVTARSQSFEIRASGDVAFSVQMEETDPMSLNDPITGEVPEGGLAPFSFFVTGDTGTVQIRTNKRINN